ncbi:hypothetical protein [Clostridium botulinum]|uniref:hypothetical protein n=2 Tax=Clostridium botulinum TaxID=1491 RepID=UPI0021C0C05F|nr:hypothetical protein [Clostridium botulinum]
MFIMDVIKLLLSREWQKILNKMLEMIYGTRGLGTKVFKEFESRLKGKGINEITLVTTKDYRTEGFYKKEDYNQIMKWLLWRKNFNYIFIYFMRG